MTTIYGNSYDIFKSPVDSGYYAISTIASSDTGATVTQVGNDGSVSWSNVYKNNSLSYPLWGFNGMILPDHSLFINTYDDGKTTMLKMRYDGSLISAKKIISSGSTIYSQTVLNNSIYGVGRTSIGETNGGLFIKLDLKGDFLLGANMSGGTSRRVVLQAITPTADQNLLLAGYGEIYSTTLPRAAILIKTDTLGNIIWQRQIDCTGINLFPTDIKETADHGFLIVISNTSGGSSQLLKTDSLGNVLWNYGFWVGSSNQKLTFYDISDAGSNNFATGASLATTLLARNLSFKIDSSGNVIDSKEYIIADTIGTMASCYDVRDGLVSFGLNYSFTNFAYFINKTDSSLNGACNTSQVLLSPYSNTLMDSAASIVSQAVTFTLIDVLPSISIAPLMLQNTDYCNAVSVNEYLAHDETLWVHPIPASSEVVFQFKDNLIGQGKINIFDVTGKFIEEFPIHESNFVVKRNGLKSGIYFYHYQTESKNSFGKIIFD
ncbi:MAG: T9SS type A sorting domain-containing protein [Bacteroidetes bacterium]|nr:T9SS type A sorting domain-containing protein [Bacteroidota bacterium]